MATYNHLHFQTPLLAHWAAFFDLAGWKWNQSPAPVGDWVPDFYVSFECDHSECNGHHSLLVSVLPLNSIESFGNHPCLKYAYGCKPEGGTIGASASAAFGSNPSVTHFEMSHGSGGGNFNVEFWVQNCTELWEKAGHLVRP